MPLHIRIISSGINAVLMRTIRKQKFNQRIESTVGVDMQR